jgi:hypothetical protein
MWPDITNLVAAPVENVSSAAMAVVDTGAARAKSAEAATDDLRIVLIFISVSP